MRLLPAGTQGRGQHDGSCVDSLAEAQLVDPPRELSDQDRSHPLEAQLLMNTQEFDVHHPLLPAEHFHQRLIGDVSLPELLQPRRGVLYIRPPLIGFLINLHP